MIVDFPLSEKQEHAYDLLCDEITNELVFGGGARGGKTWLGSFWIASGCLSMPGSAWLIGREELKALKRTTLLTFFKVLKMLQLRPGIHYKFNQQDSVFHFTNGSMVFLAELRRMPSDPEFDRLGSYDLTGSWVDEAQEVCKDAKDALQFRLTVLSGNGWASEPKTLYTCNPGKNWLYSHFWKPLIRDGIKIEGSAFVTALYTDNPYIDHAKYKKNVIRTKNKVKIERLLHGNFEYDDAPNRLIEHNAICNLFTNDFVEGGDRYLSADIALQGSDLFVIAVWDGWRVEKIITRKKTTGKDVEDLLKSAARQHKVPQSNIVYDNDGVGGFLGGYLENAKPFVNNARAMNDENYSNLKTQCYFKLAERISANEIYIECDDAEMREKIEEELAQVRQKDVDKDGPLRLVPKEKIKEAIGRSPDFADALMMRCVFDIEPPEEEAGFIEL